MYYEIVFASQSWNLGFSWDLFLGKSNIQDFYLSYVDPISMSFKLLVVWLPRKKIQCSGCTQNHHNGEFEGCEDVSWRDDDPEDLDYTQSKDMERDEPSGFDDLNNSESSDLDDVLQPNMNLGQQNTTTQPPKGWGEFSWWNKPFETLECTFSGQCNTYRQSSYATVVFHNSRNVSVTDGRNKFVQGTKTWMSQQC